MTSDPAGFLPRDFTACRASGASRMGEVEVSADSQVGGGGLSAGEGKGGERGRTFGGESLLSAIPVRLGKIVNYGLNEIAAFCIINRQWGC